MADLLNAEPRTAAQLLTAAARAFAAERRETHPDFVRLEFLDRADQALAECQPPRTDAITVYIPARRR